MTSFVANLRTAAGRLFLRDTKVTALDELSPSCRLLRLEGGALVGVQAALGDKLQVLVPDAGMRTYTPIDVDPTRGALSLVVFLQGDGPAARWARRLSRGDEVLVFGPRRSLALEALAGPLVLAGDETSFALATEVQRRRASARVVLEVSSGEQAAEVLAALGVVATVVPRSTGDAHHPSLEAALRSALSPETTLVLTGRGRTIQALRAGLRAKPTLHARQCVKAYWADGKSGLD